MTSNFMISWRSDGTCVTDVDYFEPHHATRIIRGIEIDVGICDLIEFLWDRGFETLRSCEDVHGEVYIAFRTVCDAANAGLLVATMFRMRITPNNVDGGYAAPAIYIPIERLQYPGTKDAKGELCRSAQKVLKPVMKNLTRTTLIKRAYNDPDFDDRRIALGAMAILSVLDETTIYVFNKDGRVGAMVKGGTKPRSKAELLQIESDYRTEYMVDKITSTDVDAAAKSEHGVY